MSFFERLNNNQTANTNTMNGGQRISNLQQSHQSLQNNNQVLGRVPSTRLNSATRANQQLNDDQMFQAANDDQSSGQGFSFTGSPQRHTIGASATQPLNYRTNLASQRYSVLGNLHRRARQDSATQLQEPLLNTDIDPQIHNEDNEQQNRLTTTVNQVVDHSLLLGGDYSKFLFDELLSDVQIKVSKKSLNFISSPSQSSEVVSIPAHKIVLAARCSYFYSQFCREWADCQKNEAFLPEFQEGPMREFLRYLYTGKLTIDLQTVMGVLKISSYFNLDQLVKACKGFLLSEEGGLTAFDLCDLYCEVRGDDADFDDMRQFLTHLIPTRMDKQILCRVLKQIWISPNLVNKSKQSLSLPSSRQNSEEMQKIKSLIIDTASIQQTNEIVEFDQSPKKNQESKAKLDDLEESKEENQKTTVLKASNDAVDVVIRGQSSCSNSHENSPVQQKSSRSKSSQSSEAAHPDNFELEESPLSIETPEQQDQQDQQMKSNEFLTIKEKTKSKKKVCASNEFEREEKRDLQEILLAKIQLHLPEILKNEETQSDLFELPRDALNMLFSESETCLGEFQLFQAIQERIELSQNNQQKLWEPNHMIQQDQLKEITEEGDSNPIELHEVVILADNDQLQTPRQNDIATQDLERMSQVQFLKQMLLHVRLPLISMKQLVTNIKFSNFFQDQAIFEAIQFQVAQDVLSKETLLSENKFRHRGIRTVFDHKHFDLSVQPSPTGGFLTIKRDKVCQSADESTISAIMGDPLPLHGIHYWEIKLKTSNPAYLKKVYVGLCSLADNSSLEDTWRSKSAVLLNCFDSSFWNHGQQIQVFSNKYIKIKQPVEDTDVIRIAVDLRMAHQFETFWQNSTSTASSGAGNNHVNIAGGFQDNNTHNNTGGIAGQNFNNNQFLNGAQRSLSMFRDSARPIETSRARRGNPRDNLNLLLNTTNPHESMMFFSSPCKFHFGCNSSDFHEGVDLNLINLNESPLHLCVSLPEKIGVEVLISRAIYFCDWDLIPKQPFLLNKIATTETKDQTTNQNAV